MPSKKKIYESEKPDQSKAVETESTEPKSSKKEPYKVVKGAKKKEEVIKFVANGHFTLPISHDGGSSLEVFNGESYVVPATNSNVFAVNLCKINKSIK